MKNYKQALNMIAHLITCKESAPTQSIADMYEDEAWGMCKLAAYIYSCDGHHLTTCRVYTEAKELLEEPYEIVYE